MEADSLPRAGEDEATINVLKNLESARDKIHGLNPLAENYLTLCSVIQITREF